MTSSLDAAGPGAADRPLHQDRPQHDLDLGAGAAARLAGVIAYIAVEILPELFRSRTTRRALRGVRRALDPEQDLRRLENAARHSGGVASRQRYAEELLRQGRHAEAIGVYRQALTGLYEHDPNLMLGLARAQFAPGRCGGRARHARRTDRAQPGIQVARGPPAVCARARGRGPDRRGAGRVRVAGAVLRRRRGAAALRPAAEARRPRRRGAPRPARTARSRARRAAPLPQGAARLARCRGARARRIAVMRPGRAGARRPHGVILRRTGSARSRHRVECPVYSVTAGRFGQ